VHEPTPLREHVADHGHYTGRSAAGESRYSAMERGNTGSDAVDGAHSAASKCYRLVASKPERFKEVRPGNDDGV